MNSFQTQVLILGFSTILGAFILNTMTIQNTALTTQGEARDILLPVLSPTGVSDVVVLASPTPSLSTAPSIIRPTKVPTLSVVSVAPSRIPTVKAQVTPIDPPTKAPTNKPTPIDTLFLSRDGFGKDTTGGYRAKSEQIGNVIQVTTLSDNKITPETGSLRWALQQKGPLYITFAKSGTIFLQEDIFIPSDTTIDGRGQNVTISMYGLYLEEVNNVIVTHLQFADGYQAGVEGCDDNVNYGDAIQMRKSSNVWIHKNSFSHYCDGLIDILDGSNNVTISWNRFFNHNKTMLIGNDDHKKDLDSAITVTVHHNYFQGTGQRNPRVRFGKVDFYNNYVSNWYLYGVGHAVDSQIIVEENIFEAGRSSRASNKIKTTEGLTGYLKVQGNNILINDAELNVFEPQKVFTRPYASKIDQAGENLKITLQNETGSGFQNGLHDDLLSAIDNAHFSDLNNDGVINTTDLLFCIVDYGARLTFEAQEEGESLTCDTDVNGFVNAIDYSRVVSTLGMSISEVDSEHQQSPTNLPVAN